MSSDAMKEALKKIAELAEEGSEIRKIAMMSIDEEYMDACDALHTLFCAKDHEDTCKYLKEEQISSTWFRETHRQWLGITEALFSSLGLTTFQDIKTAMEALAEVASIVDPLPYPKFKLIEALIIHIGRSYNEESTSNVSASIHNLLSAARYY